jgi:acyl-homoserine-lactone acylase
MRKQTAACGGLDRGRQALDWRWSASDPLGTPRQIADPARAVKLLVEAADVAKTRFGSLDVPWGNSNRFARDAVDLPGNGAPGQLGVFRVIEYAPLLGKHAVASAGDSFIAAVEFSNPVQARVLIAYGNASQPGSKHRSDQLHLAAERQLRPVWISRAEVETHLESRDSLR